MEQPSRLSKNNLENNLLEILLELPEEMFVLIISYLDTRSLTSLAGVNKTYNQYLKVNKETILRNIKVTYRESGYRFQICRDIENFFKLKNINTNDSFALFMGACLNKDVAFSCRLLKIFLTGIDTFRLYGPDMIDLIRTFVRKIMKICAVKGNMECLDILLSISSDVSDSQKINSTIFFTQPYHLDIMIELCIAGNFNKLVEVYESYLNVGNREKNPQYLLERCMYVTSIAGNTEILNWLTVNYAYHAKTINYSKMVASRHGRYNIVSVLEDVLKNNK